MIKVTDCVFSYRGAGQVLTGLSLDIAAGEYVAVMGRNGSGKSTLGKLIKGLLVPDAGIVSVDGHTAETEARRFEMMRRVGMVFQNPDNTIVTTTVEREIAFGLENLGVASSDVRCRVNDALERFDLVRYRHSNPTGLSGGEKQRLALAAVMVMRPEHLILDEPTSLLDPWSRGRILALIHEMAREGATVIHITQFNEEARHADRLIVVGDGGVEYDGDPSEGLDLHAGLDFCATPPHRPELPATGAGGAAVLKMNQVAYSYDRGTPFETPALHDIDTGLGKGGSMVVIGPSGAGKTTFLEIAAGVTSPTAGTVHCGGTVRRAMAFQFPEDQMSGDTVLDYVAFGPRNLGYDETRTSDAVNRSLRDVGLDPGRFCNRDPLTLSGGEKRRAAIAGVLAMSPDLLVLDEPTAGLDREGMRVVLAFLRHYLEDGGSLIFSTHDFVVARCLAGTAGVLVDGTFESCGTLEEVFHTSSWINAVSDYVPLNES